MKISELTKGYVDVEIHGKTVRCWGDLCSNGFTVIASTMEWISPEMKRKVNDEEMAEIMKEVKNYCRKLKFKFKVIFVDDKGKKMKI